MVRPTKEGAARRRRNLQIRLLDAEYALIREAADQVGLDMSSYARTTLLRQAKQDIGEQEDDETPQPAR